MRESYFRDIKLLIVDMDNTLCDYKKGFRHHSNQYPSLKFPQSQPGLYISLEPFSGALETYRWLHNHPCAEVFILTAPSIKNPHSYSEKRLWVENHLGMEVVERLIISPHKGLNRGDYLIDDCDSGKGQERFEGALIQFGSSEYPNWQAVKVYFESRLAP